MTKKKRPTKPKAKATEPPTCNCILLCDDVQVSHGKNKHTLQGIIGAIGVLSFPAILGNYVAYVRISNLYGPQKVTLDFQNTRTNETIFGFEAGFPDQNDPLGVYTLVVPIPPFRIAEPGRYMFTAWSSNRDLLAQTPIVVQGPPERPKGESEA